MTLIRKATTIHIRAGMLGAAQETDIYLTEDDLNAKTVSTLENKPLFNLMIEYIFVSFYQETQLSILMILQNPSFYFRCLVPFTYL